MATPSSVPSLCSTRGAPFEPFSKRAARAKYERREAVAKAAERAERQKHDERALARAAKLGDRSLSTGARLAFIEDSENPRFEKLRGKKYNW